MPFAVVKQRDADPRDNGWAEWFDDESDPDFCPIPLAHRTKAGAEAARRKLTPEGKDPWVWGSLKVEEVAPDNRLWIEG